MRTVFTIIFPAALIGACYKAPGEDDLKWSCATVQTSGPATASSDCLEELQKTRSAVLKYYTPVPETSAPGVVERYLLVEKDSQRISR